VDRSPRGADVALPVSDPHVATLNINRTPCCGCARGFIQTAIHIAAEGTFLLCACRAERMLTFVKLALAVLSFLMLRQQPRRHFDPR